MTQKKSLLCKGMLLACLVLSLSGCAELSLFSPAGMVGQQQKTLILTALGLMLLVVVPVIVLTLVIAWKYRASNTAADYDAEWSHSNRIEFVVWMIPAVIVLILGTLVWITCHKLDPYRPLDVAEKPIEVEAVSLDWKWLFIYPELNVASVNQLVFPARVPVHFKITSTDVMNSFFIPKLGSQIYAMPGMRTQLHLLANEPGSYDGISSNYSGRGFSDMKFKAVATSNEEFAAWVAKAKQSGQSLDTKRYRALEAPSVKHPVEYFASVKSGLFECILHKDMHTEMKPESCEEN